MKKQRKISAKPAKLPFCGVIILIPANRTTPVLLDSLTYFVSFAAVLLLSKTAAKPQQNFLEF